MANNENTKIKKIKIAITHGDINSISYEIMLKAFKDPRMLEFFTPVIYGSPKVAAYYKKVLKLSSVQLNHIKTIDKADPLAINIINCVDSKIKVEIGRPTEISGKAAIDALKCAIRDLKLGKVDILVTAPISKQAVFSQDFQFKGHTWFLANEFGQQDVLMFMVYDNLRIAVATDHIPINQVSSALTTELIVNKLELMNQSLKTDFAIDRPLIAVLALNPHAGDNGLIGDEEQKIIIPAIEQAKEKGIMVLGPYPADGFFASGNYKNFAAVLAMYHDQGMIPFKIISQNKGVNFTAGLPIIRTSPAHGTAYDIAGLNQADPASFINAMFLAREIYKNRKLFENIQPLEKQNMDELLHTLKPAKVSEIQEVDQLQTSDSGPSEQDEHHVSSLYEKAHSKAVHEHEQKNSSADQTQKQQSSEQQLQSPPEEQSQEPEQQEDQVITGDYPEDVELEEIPELIEVEHEKTHDAEPQQQSNNKNASSGQEGQHQQKNTEKHKHNIKDNVERRIISVIHKKSKKHDPDYNELT